MSEERKMIDKNLDDKIELLRKKYILFSPEDELICRVSGKIHCAARSLIPNSDLRIAQDNVEMYEERGRNGYTIDGNLIRGLWEIVNEAWDKYGEVEIART